MTEMQIERKRGGFLSVWLILLAVFSSILLIVLLGPPTLYSSYFSFIRASIPAWRLAVFPVVIILAIVFIRAAWKWKKWGVLGLYGMAIAASAIALAFANASPNPDATIFIFPLGLVVIALTAVLAILVRPVWKYFEGDVLLQQHKLKEIQIEKKRRRFLSVWLIYLLFFNSLFMLSTSVSRINYVAFDWDFTEGAGLVFILVGIVLSIVFSLAALMWKKWGIVGVTAMTIWSSVICIVNLVIWNSRNELGPRIDLVLGIVGIVILAILVRPVWKYFKWR